MSSGTIQIIAHTHTSIDTCHEFIPVVLYDITQTRFERHFEL